MHEFSLTRRQFIRVGAAASGIAPFLGSFGTAEDKAKWQIGCYTRPWAEHEYRVAFDAIAEAGFKHVGLMGSKTGLVISAQTTPDEAQRVGEETRKRGLEVPSAWGGDIPVDQSLEAGIAGMRRLIDNCAVAGVRNVLMGGVSKPELVDPYYRAIAETCSYAREKGVAVSIKPHGNDNSTGPQCRKLIGRVGCSNFGLWYDPGNIFYYSEGQIDPVADSATVDGLVMGMAVKDYQHPKNVEVTPGTGKVDFQAVLKNLMRGGFRSGALVVETLKPGSLPELLEQAKQARRFVESLVAE